MKFTVYENQNGRAVDIGNVSAPSYDEAKAFVISTGLKEEDFFLLKIEG